MESLAEEEFENPALDWRPIPEHKIAPDRTGPAGRWGGEFSRRPEDMEPRTDQRIGLSPRFPQPAKASTR